MERMKMRKEAHFIESIRLNGRWADDMVYAILAREWKMIWRDQSTNAFQ